jgi:predicted ABC-type transport system involved in lysophospholipase L1 biosynthesis ATPase subunit
VIATHDPAIAERCQHVIRMRDGRITDLGPVARPLS